MAQCRECGKEFIQNRPFQVFCDDRCKGAYHRRRYRQMAVEEAEQRREARMNGHSAPTAEERQSASDVLARIVEKAGPRLHRRF
jgi:hypothetical protein